VLKQPPVAILTGIHSTTTKALRENLLRPNGHCLASYTGIAHDGRIGSSAGNGFDMIEGIKSHASIHAD
jgi:hypothetical protein